MEAFIIFGAFLVSLALSLISRNAKLISLSSIISSIISFFVCIYLMHKITHKVSLLYFNDILFLDPYSAIQLFIISGVSLISSIYSRSYILNELNDGVINIGKVKMYFAFFDLFILSMFLLAFSNNIMLMWIAIEATTLATALLIGFHSDHASLDAAWKYVILCSIGIAIGLLGILLFLYSFASAITLQTLNWTYLSQHFSPKDVAMAKVAFVLIFVGIGTKAGLSPMHTWLPYAHSEAPSPLSAMMSGILLNLALYFVIRFYIIIKTSQNFAEAKQLFIVFGLLSLIISTFSLLRQNNYKKMFAFSSVENMGIISLGIGIGNYIAVFGAILHSVIHAYTKALLFLVAGNILKAFKTKRIDRINSLVNAMPINAVFLMIGMLGITGAPPFASFFSEYYILISCLLQDAYIAAFIYAISLLIAFAGFLIASMKMLYSKSEEKVPRLKDDKLNTLPLVLSLVFMVLISLSMFGGLLKELIVMSVQVIGFGGIK